MFKKLLKEFKEFAMKGNVIDMAVGVIIGAAFGKVVQSVIDIFLNPLLTAINSSVKIPEDVENYVPGFWDTLISSGFAKSIISFLAVLLEFLITALVLFAIIKAVNAAKKVGKKPEEPAAPTTRDCPFCCSSVSIKATRCPNCTSELPKYEPAK